MEKCYINGVGCISAQEIATDGIFEIAELDNTQNIVMAKQPSYKGMFPPAAARRMAKGVKMGIYASNKALEEAGVAVPDAIITGTGMGCLKDSEKFLKAIWDNDEQFLTPTSFIQSTHNTVGGQIALGLQCNGYNFTYVNGAVSFEAALIDAKLQVENEEENSILIGGIDEASDFTFSLLRLVNIIKKEEDTPYSVLNSNSKGVVQSEGAGFFVVESQKKDSTYAVVEDVEIKNEFDVAETKAFINDFLVTNGLSIEDIDAVVLGNNGDIEFDDYYTEAEDLFKATPQLYYKHLTGEYNTVSSIGLYIAVNIVKNQKIDKSFKMNDITNSNYNTVLLYNQYRGKDHSLILIKQC